MIEVGDLYIVWDRLWIVTGPMATETGERAWMMSPLGDMSEWMWDYESDILEYSTVYRKVA